jgi:hypothetical protein
MLPTISGYGLSSESRFSIVCPHCKQVNEIKVARFVVAVSRSESFVCVACEGKFEVAVLPQPAGNLTPRALDVCPAVTDGIHLWTVNGIDETRICKHCGKRQ